jgi:DNA-binding CsgD family transcriptional regulator
MKQPLNNIEKKALYLIVEGKTNAEIAKATGWQLISIQVVLQRLYKKIGARNKHHAAAIAVKHDFSFNDEERFLGVPMKVIPDRPLRKRMIRNCPDLW